MKIYTADRETGTFIECFNTFDEAEAAINAYEESDKADGIYEDDFYAIVDEDHCMINIDEPHPML